MQDTALDVLLSVINGLFHKLEFQSLEVTTLDLHIATWDSTISPVFPLNISISDISVNGPTPVDITSSY